MRNRFFLLFFFFFSVNLLSFVRNATVLVHRRFLVNVQVKRYLKGKIIFLFYQEPMISFKKGCLEKKGRSLVYFDKSKVNYPT